MAPPPLAPRRRGPVLRLSCALLHCARHEIYKLSSTIHIATLLGQNLGERTEENNGRAHSRPLWASVGHARAVLGGRGPTTWLELIWSRSVSRGVLKVAEQPTPPRGRLMTYFVEGLPRSCGKSSMKYVIASRCDLHTSPNAAQPLWALQAPMSLFLGLPHPRRAHSNRDSNVAHALYYVPHHSQCYLTLSCCSWL